MPPGSVVAPDLRHQLLVDVALHFGQHCRAELDDLALDKLLQAIDQSLYVSIQAGALSWNASSRKFVLGCVAEAAERCDQLAREGKEETPDGPKALSADGKVNIKVMDAMASVLIPQWQKRCTLTGAPPEEQLERMGPPCAVVATVLLIV